MKACGYCGGESAVGARVCYHCGSELAEEPAPPPVAEFQVDVRHVDAQKIPGALDFDGAFSRARWDVIQAAIEASVEPEARGDAWDEAAAQWLQQVAVDLGGSYQLSWSERFFLITSVSSESAASLLRFAERARQMIDDNLGDMAWKANAREVIIVFDEPDDYYCYIAHFYETDKMPRTAGVCLRTGYPQIAVIYRNHAEACHTIAHELTHGALLGLPLPLWLEEGVCETLERMISSTEGTSSGLWSAGSAVMWAELAERHQAFWTEKNIQEFWAGTSFGYEQEAQELSYSLAEVLVHLLSADHNGFMDFLSRAHYDDAGQTAALESLDRNLGDVVGEFLGPGDWRPYRKAMVDIWTASRRTASEQDQTAAPD